MTNVSCEGLLTLQLVGLGATKLKEIEQKINSICNTKVSTYIYGYVISLSLYM